MEPLGVESAFMPGASDERRNFQLQQPNLDPTPHSRLDFLKSEFP